MFYEIVLSSGGERGKSKLLYKDRRCCEINGALLKDDGKHVVNRSNHFANLTEDPIRVFPE
jgi:hypothetical protein